MASSLSTSLSCKNCDICDIFVITEDIYLRVCSLSKEQSILHTKGDNSKCIFFSELCPFFRLRLFVLYQVPNSRALAPECDALVYNNQLNYEVCWSLDILEIYRKRTVSTPRSACTDCAG